MRHIGRDDHDPHPHDIQEARRPEDVRDAVGAPWPPRLSGDIATIKALARAFRGQRMLDDGVCVTMDEVAKRERVNRGYMSRVLRLTLLAPDVVEAVLDGRPPLGCGWRNCGTVSTRRDDSEKNAHSGGPTVMVHGCVCSICAD